MPLPFRPTLAMTALLCALGGCTSTPMPTLPQAGLPGNWPATAAAAPAPDLRHWWLQFSDPILNGLVERALTDNLSLAQARLRIQQERVLLGTVDSNFLPELHASSAGVQSADGADSFFQFGLDATWELPLFGRKQASTRIAQAGLDSATSDGQAIRVSIVAEVVRTYVELRTAQQQLAVQQQVQVLEEERVRLLGERVRLGLSAASELVPVQATLDADRAALPQRQQDIEQVAWRLAVLLGQPTLDTSLLNTAAQPVLAPFAFNALPADLLRTRPEIRSAEAAVLQAAGDLGVARADIYPNVTIGGAYIFSANITQNFIRDGDFHGTPSLAPDIDLPLFDWGRRRALVHAHELALDAALTGYRQAVLEAISEVQQALAALNGQQARVQQEQVALHTAAHSLDASQGMRHLGLASQLDTLAEQQHQAELQLELAEAQAGHDLAYIALYKALGGAALPAGEGS